MNPKSHPLLGAMPKRASSVRSRNPFLTGREKQILVGVCYGWPNKRMAVELNISIKTVEKHHQSINRKIGKGSIASLIHWALKNNIIDLAPYLALERLPA